jgi:hypothetical protein
MKQANNKLMPKIKKISPYELKGYGSEPTWKDIKSISDKDYVNKTVRAINWYYQFYSRKDFQEWAVAWYHNHCPKRKNNIKFINSAKSHTISNLIGCLYPMELQGWYPKFSILRKIKKDFDIVIKNGKEHKSVDVIDKPAEPVIPAPVINIQERIKDQAVLMSDELEAHIEQFTKNPDAFDPKQIKVINLLKGKGVKAAHARYIKTFFEKTKNEYQLALQGQDSQIKEAYNHVSKKNIKKIIEFLDQIFTSCDQLIGESKALRKPKPKKVQPVDEQIKKLKYKISDDKLGIAGLSATHIVGAQTAVVFNTTTRKIGIYNSTGIEGLSVKGTSIINFNNNSKQKTLRKPVEQLKEIKTVNSIKKFNAWFNAVNSIDTDLTGRMNEDTLILKIFK